MKTTFLCIAALGLAGLVRAQSSTTFPAAMTVTLEQCITLALQNQPVVRQADLQKQIADNSVEQTRRSQLPTLLGVSNQALNFGRNVDPFTNGIVNNRITTNNAGLNLNWVVFNGFQLKHTLDQQNLLARASQHDADATRNNVTLNTLLAYLQVLSAQDMLAASEVQVSVARAQVERMEKLVKAGTVSPYNLYDARSQLANDDMQRVQAQTNLNTAHLALLQALNLPSGTLLAVARLETDPQHTARLANPASVNAHMLYEQARSIMPDVLAADLRTKAAQKGVDIARGLAYPTVSLLANWGTAFSSAARQVMMGNELVEQPTSAFVTVGEQVYPVRMLSPVSSQERINYFRQLDNNQFKAIGFSVRVPILNGFQVRYRTTNARLQQQLAESQGEDVRRTLRQAVDQAVTAWQNAYDRYVALDQQVTVLQQSYKAAEARYNAGLLNAVDYNLAKSNLDRASVNLIQARYETLLRAKVAEFYRNGTL
ncbi:TolC family protein [Spirosoma montaniterrae]|uniref:Transporter n=1 Tax=Spirosoma montaniterrae TaxID=1178516 RepID=A0A1P9WXN5_9BACT|nr:TolC family protein [Spirosoma montaniterrae]AQG80144.1 hypothetical protein AWR27_12925 [Spirosoma montaniterrae]